MSLIDKGSATLLSAGIVLGLTGYGAMTAFGAIAEATARQLQVIC